MCDVLQAFSQVTGSLFIFSVMMAKEKPPITVVGDVGGRIAIIVVRCCRRCYISTLCKKKEICLLPLLSSTVRIRHISTVT